MGYGCPVCETPQADAGHLANHLAFTAMLGDDDHETWLDEHAPGWSEAGERDLADRVIEHAPEVEFPQVFEDTTGEGHRHGHDHDEPRPGALFEDDRDHDVRGPRGHDGYDGPGGHEGSGRRDGLGERDGLGGRDGNGHDADAASNHAVAEAMAEARELTRQRRGDEEDDESGEGTVASGDTDEHAERNETDSTDGAESQ